MMYSTCFFVQAEDGIRDLVRSRGLGDVYKRQEYKFHLTNGDDAFDRIDPYARQVTSSVGNGVVYDLSLIHI